MKKWDAVARYWKAQARALAEQSDDALEEDSQDKRDHSSRSSDPQAATLHLPRKGMQ